MKLVHPDLEGTIMPEQNDFVEWIIESPSLFSKCVQKIIQQCQNGEGDFVLSHEKKILELSKNAEIILDPFSININDKKILNKLYGELERTAKLEMMYLSTQEIKRQIYEYLLKLEYSTTAVLEINPEIDMSLLFKAAGIKIEESTSSLLEKIVCYMTTANQILGIKLFIFVNLRSYLEKIELELLIKEAEYKEIYILFLENTDRGCLENTIRYIIDKDRCEIF